VSSNDRYFVYILSNASRTLYVGVTNDLVRRVYEHKHKQTPGFTARYNVTQLVYYEGLRTRRWRSPARRS
jgi:putative endonuclease